MIRTWFSLPKIDWRVQVYVAVDCYYTDEIVHELHSLGAPKDTLEAAYRNLSACALDKGFTFSNLETHETLIVIGMASSKEEYFNSMAHESQHLISHICQAYEFDPNGEPIAYIAGDIGANFYRLSAKLKF